MTHRHAGAQAPPSFTLAAFEEPMTDALIALWRTSFEHGVGVRDPHPIAEQRAYFCTQVRARFTVSVALDRMRQLAGFIACTPESVGHLYVRIGDQRQGIGSALLRLAQAGSSGSLWLYTFARNRVARRFYERHGFVAVAHGFEPTWRLADVKYEWKLADESCA